MRLCTQKVRLLMNFICFNFLLVLWKADPYRVWNDNVWKKMLLTKCVSMAISDRSVLISPTNYHQHPIWFIKALECNVTYFSRSSPTFRRNYLPPSKRPKSNPNKKSAKSRREAERCISERNSVYSHCLDKTKNFYFEYTFPACKHYQRFLNTRVILFCVHRV